MESRDTSATSGVRIALVGVGAVGCALLPRLLRMPLRTIMVVDGDRVEASNLGRQELYAPVDVGRPKVEVAAAWARVTPVDVQVIPKDAFLDVTNAEDIIPRCDILADCTDDGHARRLIDRTCSDHGVTLVSGAVHQHQGQVIVLHAPGPGEEISLPDLFPGSLADEQDGCDMRAVPARAIEEVAARMAWRIRELINGSPVLNGRVEVYSDVAHEWMHFAPPVRS